ncbi:MAG: ABC transporter ATP-binding protein [Desulfotignum balticum]|uniref:ABC transporter ATP-binding protein n=1 Tax=Desulfotignum balticum TaxID=115781 RepID=A0A931CS02_9BACT|nr:ABC transporter ATP-binding protein [Desulfotignum balticum]
MTLEIQNLSAGYGSTPVISGIHMTADPGRICSVMGRNGSGKTTLLRCINHVLPPLKGKIRIMGQEITRMARHRIAQIISVVPQGNFSPFSFSCRDMVLMAGAARIRAWAAPSRKEQEQALSAMAEVGIDHLATQAFNAISGGERQLVMLARALFQETPIMLLDEPTAHLDFTNQHRIMALMRKLVKKRQMTVIITLHDPNLTYHYCDDVVLIHQGRVAAAGKTADTLTGDMLARVLGDNIRLEGTTGGVRVAVPASFDPATNRPKHASAKPLTTHQEKRVV